MKYEQKGGMWWVKNLNLVLDGVTLTMPPKNFHLRKRHAAQTITHVWVKSRESLDKDVHTYNRYGVQLGTKVPLWRASQVEASSHCACGPRAQRC